MEELTDEELIEVHGGATKEIESKLIQKHVKNKEKYKIKDIAKIDGNLFNVFLRKANWVYGGNECAFILNGRKYDATNTSSINKGQNITNATVEFYKKRPDVRALIYIELAYKIKPVRESKIESPIHIYKINVFID